MMMPPGGGAMMYGNYGDQMPAGQQLASLGARLGGFIVDLIVGCICIGPGFAMIFSAAMRAAQSGNSNPDMGSIGFGWTLTMLGSLAVLIVQAVLISLSGQTIGKKIVGIRIVRLDGSLPGFVYGFLMRSIVGYLPAAIPFLGLIYILVDWCFVFRQDRRCIHDLIAGTRVINA